MWSLLDHTVRRLSGTQRMVRLLKLLRHGADAIFIISAIVIRNLLTVLHALNFDLSLPINIS